MAVTVRIETGKGPTGHTGHIVCRGPGTMEMLHTEPLAPAGRTVQIPAGVMIAERPRADLSVQRRSGNG